MLFFQVWIEGKCYFKSTNIHLLFKIIAHLNSLKRGMYPHTLEQRFSNLFLKPTVSASPGDILEIKLFEHNPRSTASCHVGQFSCSVMSDSLQPHVLQHARLPCPSPTPRASSNSCQSSQWCHPTISFLLFYYYYYVASVVSDSVQPHRRQPTRLRCPWDSPGKNTGVGCHFLSVVLEPINCLYLALHSDYI